MRTGAELQFIRKVDRNGPTVTPETDPLVTRWDLGPCWVWQGEVRRDGYGYFYLKGRQFRAHRFAYEHFVGPLPPELDHLCRVRACVRPSHLEPVTHEENQQRGLLGLRREMMPLLRPAREAVSLVSRLLGVKAPEGALTPMERFKEKHPGYWKAWQRAHPGYWSKRK